MFKKGQRDHQICCWPGDVASVHWKTPEVISELLLGHMKDEVTRSQHGLNPMPNLAAFCSKTSGFVDKGKRAKDVVWAGLVRFSSVPCDAGVFQPWALLAG